MKQYRYILLFCVVLLFAVSSCKIGKKYARPEMSLPEQLDPATSTPDTFSIADMHWWEVYGDTILQNLIRQTLEHNKDMLAASARIKELAALRRVDFSKIFPQIDGRIYADKDATNYGGNDYSNDPEHFHQTASVLGSLTCGEIFVGEQRKEKRNYSKRSKTNAPCK